MQFWQWVVIWYVVTNIGGFLAFASDKYCAKTGKRRIMERDLILLAAIGGGLGCLLGMILCHHKTRKKKFTVAVPFFLVLYIAVTCFFTYQNNNLVITKYDPGTSIGVRAVQISDLHNMKIWWDKDRIIRETSALDPDVIFLTGEAGVEAEMKGLRMGAEDFIRKPIFAEKCCFFADSSVKTAGTSLYYPAKGAER